jgi:hypothetical protein
LHSFKTGDGYIAFFTTVLRHIIARVLKNLLSQNAPKHLSALFEFIDVKNVP